MLFPGSAPARPKGRIGKAAGWPERYSLAPRPHGQKAGLAKRPVGRNATPWPRARTAKRRDWQSGRLAGTLLPGSAPARPKGGIGKAAGLSECCSPVPRPHGQKAGLAKRPVCRNAAPRFRARTAKRRDSGCRAFRNAIYPPLHIQKTRLESRAFFITPAERTAAQLRSKSGTGEPSPLNPRPSSGYSMPFTCL